MKSAKQVISEKLILEGLNYIEKNPTQNLDKLVSWGEKFISKESHKQYAQSFHEIVKDPENNWHKLMLKIFTDYDKEVVKKFIINFMVQSTMVGVATQEKFQAQYNCNIPWAILMDPTAACNLKCTGCWASEYKKTTNMSTELLDRIITEGKELGIYMYIYSGGEPLIRAQDLIKLAEKHDDCAFLAFTNATLIDNKLAEQFRRVKNFACAISVEGFEVETDMRRGKGTYRKVIQAMDILKSQGVPFGFSTCYHRYNTDVVGSEEYIDYMIEKGCLFGWYFTYIPLGKDAKLDLLATPEQREYMFYQVRRFRENKPLFTIDFWNDGEFSQGCIAGGRKYLHINSNGDVEPCAFIHYSNVNIKDVSLLEALQSPLFMEYHKNQPFNSNYLQPCPLLDNPHCLRTMVHNSGAHSTQPLDEEDVNDLTAKTANIARQWSKIADQLWVQHHSE